MLKRAKDAAVQPYPWGRLEWLCNGGPGEPQGISVARMFLRAGQQSALHRHGNCDEVLHLASGRLEQTVGDGPPVAMGPGDTVFIAAGVAHRSRAVGDEEAVIHLSYSAARREYEEV